MFELGRHHTLIYGMKDPLDLLVAVGCSSPALNAMAHGDGPAATSKKRRVDRLAERRKRTAGRFHISLFVEFT